jgi:hypothetical protein
VQGQLVEANKRIRTLEADNLLLLDRIRTLTAVITELTLQASVDRVTPMVRATRPRARGRSHTPTDAKSPEGA